MNLSAARPALAALLLATLAVLATPAGAADLSVVFSSKEVAIIRDYYRSAPPTDHYSADAGKGKSKGGKQANGGLPPGIAKNLARGKPLPPGIAKKQLPDSLLRQLPPVRTGYERVVVDGKVLLIEIATQTVRDVLTDLMF